MLLFDDDSLRSQIISDSEINMTALWYLWDFAAQFWNIAFWLCENWAKQSSLINIEFTDN